MKRWSAAWILLILGVALGVPLAVHAGPAQEPPGQGTVAVITSPKDNAILRGRVVITGSADDPNFWKYEVHYAREPVAENWVLIGTVHEQPVLNGVLETWDTTLVPDGAYSLRLRVVRRDGNYDEWYVRGLSVANAQPTETPTPVVEATPTPTITPTPLPPTPTVVIEQPVVPTPTPRPTPTPGPLLPPPEQASSPAAAFNPAKLGGAFCYGALLAVGAFVAIGVLALVRKLLVGLWALIRRR
ncbi:MAG: hypothetical protein ACP5UM_01045 [Anaerolineae bacterium]